MKLSDFNKGDWVSFMKSGEIVIGQVEYLLDNFPSSDQLITTAGSVCPQSVLERRTADLQRQRSND